jgi:predicted metal-dependent hydrolase
MRQGLFPYPYTVKHSSRARYVRLSVSAEGLVIVVPQDFCVSRDLPPILENKKDWIARTLTRVKLRTQFRESTRKLPEVIDLPAIGEQWRVGFARLERERLRAENGTVTLTADFNKNEALAVLRRWIHEKGRLHLPSMLDEAAAQCRFAYAKVSVKEQKSRWGSCSAKGNINLNSCLLFLPPHLVRHVLLHELCHLKEMNHSKAFHALLAQLDPDAQKNADSLRRSWNFVPGWATRGN